MSVADPHPELPRQPVTPAEALIHLFRLPGEDVFLQTFADQKDREDDIFKQVGRSATQTGRYPIDALAQGPYQDLNAAGAGVFWTVNVLQEGAKTRSNGAVVRVAAVFVDLDGTPFPEGGFHLPPTAIVATSPGRFHVYWAVQDLPLDEFTRLQQHLIALYKGDTKVKDLARVMRLPGYDHWKSGHPVRVRLLETRPEAQYTRADLLTHLPGLAEALSPTSPPAATPRSDRAATTARTLDRLLHEVRCAPEGERNDTLNRNAYTLGGLIASRHYLYDEVEAGLLEAGLDSGLPESEVRATVRRALAQGQASPLGELAFRGPPQVRRMPALPEGVPEGSDMANAHLLAAAGVQRHLRFTPGLGWLAYHAERGLWERDGQKVRALHLASETLRGLVAHEQAHATQSGAGADRQKLLMRWAVGVNSVNRLQLALDAAAGLPEFLTPVEAWDSDPWLLNCPNGVLDLRTGQVRDHRPEDLMTWQAGAAFDPSATHPAVTKLTHLLEQDGRAEYLQRLIGSSLYGQNPNELLTVFQGEGGTGKGTLIAATLAMLGDYATTIDIQLLLTSPRGEASTGPKPELLALRGKRLVVGGEPPKGGQFNAGRIKGMTGNDPITARDLHKPPVTFQPNFKLVLHTNYPIAATHDDTGLQRRIVVVPFHARPAKPDPAFKTSLERDPLARSAFLNWALAGFQAWQRTGFDLQTPPVIRQATDEYWEEQNPVAAFVDSILELDPKGTLLAGRLKTLFEEWQPEFAPQAKYPDVIQYLKKLGVKAGRKNQTRWWSGVTERVTPVTAVTPLLQVSPKDQDSREETLGPAVTRVTDVTEDDPGPQPLWRGKVRG